MATVHRRTTRTGKGSILYFALLSILLASWGNAQEPLLLAPARIVPVSARNKYDEHRASLVELLHQHSFAHAVQLSPAELQLDSIILAERTNDLAVTLTNGKSIPELPFLETRERIQTNRVFKVFQRMPKGGLLHVHDVSVGRAEWLATNAAHRSDCYIHWPEVQLTFQTNRPACPDCRPAAELWGTVTNLQEQLLNAFRLVPGPRGEQGWLRFGQCFTAMGNLREYWPVFEDYLIDAFSHLCEDRVPYVELRLILDEPRQPEQSQRDLALIRRFWGVRAKVREKHPEFDLKLILCGLRIGNEARWAGDLMKRAGEAQSACGLPGFVVGCDFVGDEDGGRSTFQDALAMVLGKQDHPELKLFLHDGESAWDDNENLIDAVLLQPARIGHGFNLYRFGVLEEKVKMDRIALEICPISNQLLGLTPDLRIHPAPGYFARGVQCVLSSDDPLMFGNNGLSYEFWMAYEAWGLDLGVLKKLAENSLVYSAMSAAEKSTALEVWQRQWDEWVTWANQELGAR